MDQDGTKQIQEEIDLSAKAQRVILPDAVDPSKDIEKEYNDQWFVLEQFKSSVSQDPRFLAGPQGDQVNSSGPENTGTPTLVEHSSARSSMTTSGLSEASNTITGRTGTITTLDNDQNEHEQWFALMGTGSSGSSQAGSQRSSPLTLPDPSPLISALTAAPSHGIHGNSDNNSSSSVVSDPQYGVNPPQPSDKTGSNGYKEQWYVLQELKASIKDMAWNGNSLTSETGQESDNSVEFTHKADVETVEPTQRSGSLSSGTLPSSENANEQAVNASQASVFPPNQWVSPMTREGKGSTSSNTSLASGTRQGRGSTSSDTSLASGTHQDGGSTSSNTSLASGTHQDRGPMTSNTSLASGTHQDRGPMTSNTSLASGTHQGKQMNPRSDQSLTRADILSESPDHYSSSNSDFARKSTESSRAGEQNRPIFPSEQHTMISSAALRTSPSSASDVSVDFVSLPNVSPPPNQLPRVNSRQRGFVDDYHSNAALPSGHTQAPVGENSASRYSRESRSLDEGHYSQRSDEDVWVEPSRVSDYTGFRSTSTSLPSRPLTIGKNGSSDVGQQRLVRGTDTQVAGQFSSTPVYYPQPQAMAQTQAWALAQAETSLDSIPNSDILPSDSPGETNLSMKHPMPPRERLQPDGRDGVEITAAPWTNVTTATGQRTTSSSSASPLLVLRSSQRSPVSSLLPGATDGTHLPVSQVTDQQPQAVVIEGTSALAGDMSDTNEREPLVGLSRHRQSLSSQNGKLTSDFTSLMARSGPKGPSSVGSNCGDSSDAGSDNSTQRPVRDTLYASREDRPKGTQYLQGRPKTQVSRFQARAVHGVGMVSEDEESSPVTKLLGPSFRATQQMLERLKQEKLRSYSDSGSEASRQDDLIVSGNSSLDRETLNGHRDRSGGVGHSLSPIEQSEGRHLTSYKTNRSYGTQKSVERQSESSMSVHSDTPQRGPGFAWSMPIPSSDSQLEPSTGTSSIFPKEQPPISRGNSSIKRDHSEISLEDARQKEREQILAEIEARYPIEGLPRESTTRPAQDGGGHQLTLAWQSSSSTEASLPESETVKIPSRWSDVPIGGTRTTPDLVTVEEELHPPTSHHNQQRRKSSPGYGSGSDRSSDDTDDLLSYEPVLEGDLQYLLKGKRGKTEVPGKPIRLATTPATTTDNVLRISSRGKPSGYVPQQEVKPQRSPIRVDRSSVDSDGLAGSLSARVADERSSSIPYGSFERGGTTESNHGTNRGDTVQQREDKVLRDYHLSLGAGTVTPITDFSPVDYGSYLRPRSAALAGTPSEESSLSDDPSIEEQSIGSFSEEVLSVQGDEEVSQGSTARSVNEIVLQSESSASDIYRPLLNEEAFSSSGQKKDNISYGIYDIRRSSGPGSTNRRRRAMGLEAVPPKTNQASKNLSVYVSGGSTPSSHNDSHRTEVQGKGLLRTQPPVEKIFDGKTTVKGYTPGSSESSLVVEDQVYISGEYVNESEDGTSSRLDHPPRTSSARRFATTQKKKDEHLSSVRNRTSKSKKHHKDQPALQQQSILHDKQRRQKKSTHSRSPALKNSQDLNELWNRFQRSLQTESPKSESSNSTMSRLSKLSNMIAQPLPRRDSTSSSQHTSLANDSQDDRHDTRHVGGALNTSSLSDTTSTTTYSMDDAFVQPTINTSVARQLKLRQLLKNIKPGQAFTGPGLERGKQQSSTTAISTSDLQTVSEDSTDTLTSLESRHSFLHSRPRTVPRETRAARRLHTQKADTKRSCICGAAKAKEVASKNILQDIEIQTIGSGMRDVGVNFPTPRTSPRPKERNNKKAGTAVKNVNMATQTGEDSIFLPPEQDLQLSTTDTSTHNEKMEKEPITLTKLKHKQLRDDRYVITQQSPRDERKKQQAKLDTIQFSPRKRDDRPIPCQNSPDLVRRLKEKKRPEHKPGPVWFQPVSNKHYSRPSEPLREIQFPVKSNLNRTRVDTFNTTVGAPQSLQKLSLQEAFLYAKPSFARKSRERLEKVAEKRREYELRQQQRKENLMNGDQGSDNDEDDDEESARDMSVQAKHETLDKRPRHAYSEHSHQSKRRQMTRKEMLELNKRLYNKLPEVKEMQEKKRRQAFYCSNLQRARLYGKRVRNRLEQHGN